MISILQTKIKHFSEQPIDLYGYGFSPYMFTAGPVMVSGFDRETISLRFELCDVVREHIAHEVFDDPMDASLALVEMLRLCKRYSS